VTTGQRAMLVLRMASGVIGAVFFWTAGFAMSPLRSISGDSVAEAFYQAMGTFSFGMGFLCLAVGFVPFGSQPRSDVPGGGMVQPHPQHFQQPHPHQVQQPPGQMPLQPPRQPPAWGRSR